MDELAKVQVPDRALSPKERATLPARPQRGTFVQTDRAAHERWAALGVKHPAASALLHMLAAHVSDQNAVVASQATLAKLMGASISTVKRALKVLEQGNWIEVAQIGASGTVNAYVLNSRVAWIEGRDRLQYARLRADVLLTSEEQPTSVTQDRPPLERLPRLGEVQIPAGSGLPPPSQPFLVGMEPGLPTTEFEEADE